MNKTQAKAQELYNRNNRAIDSGKIHNIDELARIGKEQDRLYVFINSRADNRHFAGKA